MNVEDVTKDDQKHLFWRFKGESWSYFYSYDLQEMVSRSNYLKMTILNGDSLCLRTIRVAYTSEKDMKRG